MRGGGVNQREVEWDIDGDTGVGPRNCNVLPSISQSQPNVTDMLSWTRDHRHVLDYIKLWKGRRGGWGRGLLEAFCINGQTTKTINYRV